MKMNSTLLTTTTSLPIDVIATTGEDDEEELSLLPLPWIAVAIVCVGFAITTAVGGNMLILLSYWRDPLLRNVHNLYLVHLAVCDCLLGGISMPLYLIYTVMNFTWPMGKVMCRLFMVEDFTLCTFSTMIVVLVAYDRLALVKLGVDYETTETRCRAYFKLTVCWLFSFLFNSPAILLWETITGRSVIPSDDCDVEFHGHFVYVLVTEVIAFAVPFFSLTVISVLLLLALNQRRNKVGIGLKGSVQGRQSPKPVQQGTMQLRHSPEQVRKSQNLMTTSMETLDLSQSKTARQDGPSDGPSGNYNSDVTASTASGSVPCSTASVSVPYSTASVSVPYSTVRRNRRSIHVNKRTLAKQREKRAALILAGLVLTLAVCWLPYTICTIIIAACDECVNEDLNEFANWLLWFKSCVNPFLYAYMSPRFRMNFLKLLGPLCPQACRKRRKRRKH
ncbi:hypothetical protein V1264_013736 [Littorina saxatilis]|uniref:G-protein coupled receptors family 1 profile domain-containing protein n=1 Tax=Littorina saxatilis TaxID=31220 RepID=A0AAN9BPE4_9CAEN